MAASSFSLLRQCNRLLVNRLAVRSIHSSRNAVGSLLSARDFNCRINSDSRMMFSTEHTFQAETRQLLDIVTNSLYTDKEVFLRELISNASDSLEKLRHLQVSGEAIADADIPLEISIIIDKEAKTLTIKDTGVGLSKEEMVNLLGTIARSGSKAFVENAKDSAAGDSIIGQFGVGFYSAFMVGNRVDVTSKPANVNEASNVWSSEGTGSYTIANAENDAELQRGCSVTIHLKPTEEEYLSADRIRAIIKKHSNFVNFNINVEGEAVNTVRAVWTESPSEVTEEEYQSFYKFSTGQFDEPKYKIHFRADAPIDLKVLLFIPSFHTEKWGQGHMEPGVSLYARKVLIEKNCKDLLPDWMRFVKGVVDSEDLPLSISREKPQDSRLLTKIQTALVKRVLKFLNQQATNEPEQYRKWFSEFGVFIKEGVCRDYANQAECAKLLYFESSTMKEGELTSLDEYIARCTPEQDQIYYLSAPNRELAEKSPYYEAFKANKREVLFVYNAIDDFVMTNLTQFNNRKIISAESDVDLGASNEDNETSDSQDSGNKLSAEEMKSLGDWMVEKLPKKLSSVKSTKRLSESPAIITEHESGSLRRMMRMVEQQNTGISTEDLMPPQTLEVNPSHPLIVGLNALRVSTDETSSNQAKLILEQVVDNAMITAGLIDDSRGVVSRINTLMIELIKATTNGPQK